MRAKELELMHEKHEACLLNNIHGIDAIYSTWIIPVMIEESSNQVLLRL